MHSGSRQKHFCFILVALIFMLAACDDSDVRVGCNIRGDHTLVKYNQNCMQEEGSGGYFSVPTAYVNSCTVVDKKNNFIHASSGSKLIMRFPLSKIVSSANGAEDAIIVNIAANEESPINKGCFEEDAAIASKWIGMINSKRLSSGKLIQYGERKYKIEGFKYDKSAAESYDIYIKIGDDNQAVYWAMCDVKNGCSLARTPILNGQYAFGANFAYDLAQYTFEIAENSKTLLENIYIKDPVNRGSH